MSTVDYPVPSRLVPRKRRSATLNLPLAWPGGWGQSSGWVRLGAGLDRAVPFSSVKWSVVIDSKPYRRWEKGIRSDIIVLTKRSD